MLHTVSIALYSVRFHRGFFTNIPGNLVERGNKVTPFSLEVDKDDPDKVFIMRTCLSPPNHILFLVFKQPARIITEQAQQGCNPEIVSAWIFEYPTSGEQVYGLQLAAGNFLQCPSGVDVTQSS